MLVFDEADEMLKDESFADAAGEGQGQRGSARFCKKDENLCHFVAAGCSRQLAVLAAATAATASAAVALHVSDDTMQLHVSPCC